MKIYETPSITLVEFESVDIVTTSEVSFKWEWLDPLSLGDSDGM